MLADLPHAHNGVCDEDEQDDKGLDEGSDRFFALLKPGQHLGGAERCSMLVIHEV